MYTEYYKKYIKYKKKYIKLQELEYQMANNNNKLQKFDNYQITNNNKLGGGLGLNFFEWNYYYVPHFKYTPVNFIDPIKKTQTSQVNFSIKKKTLVEKGIYLLFISSKNENTKPYIQTIMKDEQSIFYTNTTLTQIISDDTLSQIISSTDISLLLKLPDKPKMKSMNNNMHNDNVFKPGPYVENMKSNARSAKEKNVKYNITVPQQNGGSNTIRSLLKSTKSNDISIQNNSTPKNKLFLPVFDKKLDDKKHYAPLNRIINNYNILFPHNLLKGIDIETLPLSQTPKNINISELSLLLNTKATLTKKCNYIFDILKIEPNNNDSYMNTLISLLPNNTVQENIITTHLNSLLEALYANIFTNILNYINGYIIDNNYYVIKQLINSNLDSIKLSEYMINFNLIPDNNITSNYNVDKIKIRCNKLRFQDDNIKTYDNINEFDSDTDVIFKNSYEKCLPLFDIIICIESNRVGKTCPIFLYKFTSDTNQFKTNITTSLDKILNFNKQSTEYDYITNQTSPENSEATSSDISHAPLSENSEGNSPEYSHSSSIVENVMTEAIDNITRAHSK